jgi:hypothetical protein
MLVRSWFVALALCVTCVAPLHSGAQGLRCCPSPQACAPTVPVCPQPIVPIGPCCLPSPLFPPAPPIVAPIIVGCAAPVCVPYGPPPRLGPMTPEGGKVKKHSRSAQTERPRFNIQGGPSPAPR